MVKAARLSLYLVTDPFLCGERGVHETVRQALEAGVGTIQLRDKNGSTRELVRSAIILQEMCSRYGALFLVNDRVDVAMAAGACGVHLGQDDMPVHLARKLMGPEAVIGNSVRTPEEAVKAWRQGADYIAANMIFRTSTKTDLEGPLGVEAIRALRESTPLPLVAIGGIKAENAERVIAAGADGIAVVSAIMAADDVPGAVESLLKSCGS
ncbi:MAG: thiamine phosphate synthase [Candidatus Aegiribacteria sp.]|nr:thiamine phosphate synthase [Candidatus Aegiribacteria sp.]MBD3295694.1 thiamine phosphate synthase [Candidatus Fermentibacteria bacterium]